MSQDVDKLEASMIWEPEGHLSELALNLLVDAELSLLPNDAAQHAERCALCATRLGELANLALQIDSALHPDADAIAQPAGAALPAPRRSWPSTEIALGLLVALLGELPTLQGTTPAGIRHSLRSSVHLGLRVVEQLANLTTQAWGPMLPWLSACILLAASGCIASAARSGIPSRSGSAPSR